MTTGTLTLTDFLLARIAEDEAAAHQWLRWENRGRQSGYSPNLARARMLAECEAKREVITTFAMYGPADNEVYAAFLASFAAVHADHPDYRPEWRP